MKFYKMWRIGKLTLCKTHAKSYTTEIDSNPARDFYRSIYS